MPDLPAAPDSAPPQAVSPTPAPSLSSPDASVSPSPAVAPVESETASFRSALEGYKDKFDLEQFKDKDDQAVLEHLVNAASVYGDYQQLQQQLPALRQLAQFGQQVLPYADRFHTWLAQQPAGPAAGQGQPAAPAPAEEEIWPAAPEWDPTWEGLITPDEKGNIARPDLVPKYYAYRDHARKSLETLVRDPVSLIQKVLQREMGKTREDFAGQIDKRLADYRQEQYANSVVMANEDLLYQRTREGQFLQDAFGRKVISPFGQAMAANIQRLAEAGVTDPMRQWQMAYEMTAGGLAQQQAPSPVPPPTPEQLKEEYVRSGAAKPAQRSGTLADRPSGAAQNPSLDFGEMLDANLRRAGFKT